MNVFIKQQMLNILHGNFKKPVTDPQQIRTLIGLALASNMVLEIEYSDKEADQTKREVEPVSWDEVNVLTNCRLRAGKYRKFTINYILAARWTGEVFVPKTEDEKAVADHPWPQIASAKS